MLLSGDNLFRCASPLEIPEILDLIANFVDEETDFLTFVKVSKAWHRTFVKYRWRNITLYRSKIIPPKYILFMHAHFIKSLSMSGRIPSCFLKTPLPYLQKLTLLGPYPVNEFPFQLLTRYPAIEDLTIGQDVNIPDYADFLEDLSKLLKLKHLTIGNLIVEDESFDFFWSILCRLDSVEICNIRLYTSRIPKASDSKRLKSLTIHSGDFFDQELKLIENLKGLEHLLVPTGQLSEIINNFTNFELPNLHSINLEHIRLVDDDLELILSSVTRLTALWIRKKEQFRPAAFKALIRHFATLKVLNIPGAGNFSSTMVNTILSSCPNLEDFSGPPIKGLDIINGSLFNDLDNNSSTWVCDRLRNLQLFFDLQDVESQTPILERIARLTRLSKLDMTGSDENTPTIALSLDNGLQILEPLQYLCTMSVPGKIQSMSEDDIKWIIKHWKNLKHLLGKFHSDPDRHLSFCKLLNSNRINTEYPLVLS